MAKASNGGPVTHHAHAALLATGEAKGRKRALARLAKARAADYAEWHWIAVDPNLANLRDLPQFRALLATPPPPPVEPARVELADDGDGDDIPF